MTLDSNDPAELEARSDSTPGFDLACPSCRHESTVPNNPKTHIYTCGECGCRIACGVEMPRVFITPTSDRRFIAFRLASGKPHMKQELFGSYERDVSMPLERQYAAGLALDLLSGADPGLFQDFLAFVAAKQIAEGAVPPNTAPADGETRPDGVTLDEATLG